MNAKQSFFDCLNNLRARISPMRAWFAWRPNATENGIASYCRRHWRLLFVFAVCLALTLPNWLFGIFGMWIYLPLFVCSPFVTGSILRHIFYQSTLSEFVHSGRFVKAWNEAISERERFYITLIGTGFLIYISVLVAVALIR